MTVNSSNMNLRRIALVLFRLLNTLPATPQDPPGCSELAVLRPSGLEVTLSTKHQRMSHLCNIHSDLATFGADCDGFDGRDLNLYLLTNQRGTVVVGDAFKFLFRHMTCDPSYLAAYALTLTDSINREIYNAEFLPVIFHTFMATGMSKVGFGADYFRNKGQAALEAVCHPEHLSCAM